MKPKSLRLSFCFLFFFSIFGLNRLSLAEIDFKSLKGVHAFIELKDECEYLSPEIPLNLMRQGKLNQIYHYGDESDPKVHFIRTAFNSVSENPAFFQVSPLARNIASLLPPSVIGKILRQLNPRNVNPSIEALKRAILQDEQFKSQLARIKERKKQADQRREEYLAKSPLFAEINRLTKELRVKTDSFKKAKTQKTKQIIHELYPEGMDGFSQHEKKAKFHAITQQVEEILDPLYQENKNREASLALLRQQLDQDEVLRKLTNVRDQFNYQEKNLDHFLDLLLDAFESEPRTPATLAEHSIEQALLALGWMNGETKQEFLSLYEQLPQECFTQKGLRHIFGVDSISREKRSQWLKEAYTDQDYRSITQHLLKLSPQERAQHFLTHPDELGFLAYGRPLFDSMALPTLGFKQVEFTHPITHRTEHMPDCMEYAILNKLLNDLSGGAGNRFEVNSLEQNLNKLGYEMHPGLREFLIQHPDPSRVNELEAHKKWAELVSGLPHVKYNPLHPDHEIMPTLSNALAVFQHLLFYKKTGAPVVYEPSLRRSKKLDLICQALSRSGREVDWKLKGAPSKEALNGSEKDFKEDSSKDTNLVLEFKINGERKYDWRIDSIHSEVEPRKDDSADWRRDVGPEMTRLILEKNRFETQDRRTLAWFLNTADAPQIFALLESKRGESHYTEFLQSMPLESVDQKIFVIGELAELGKVAEIKKIYAHLPAQDRDTQKRYHATLANHHYPFPTQSKTQTGVKYELIPQHPILGRSWKDPRNVIWGDAVVDPDHGGDKRLNWENAKKHCLSLNSDPSLRERIEHELESIEFNPDLKRLRSDFLAQGTEESKEHLTQKYLQIKGSRISGCYLPPIEEYLLLGGDLGRDEKNDQYLPQFLAHLYGEDSRGNYRWFFWSSSANPNGAYDTLVFNGYGGMVLTGPSTRSSSIRCVCAEPEAS
ncbi:MAG: hypothetical protein ACO3A2_03610 [Bdellovibrionia bacterium]